MDNNNYQIIVKGKDKTKEISSFEQTGNRLEIKYLSGDKTYSYLAKDVEIIKSALLDNISGKRKLYSCLQFGKVFY